MVYRGCFQEINRGMHYPLDFTDTVYNMGLFNIILLLTLCIDYNPT